MIKSAAVLSIIAGALMGCTQTVILFKPSPILSPLPNLDCKSETMGQDPMLKDQWNLKQVGLVDDQGALQSSLAQGSKNVKIALLSTGVDYNHEDLCGQIAVDPTQLVKKAAGDKVEPKDLKTPVVGWNVVDSDGFAYDRHGAGTAVAGIIAAKQNNGKGIAGLMNNVSIYPVKYINDNGQTSVPWLVSGLMAALKARPHVIYLQSAQIQVGGQRRDADAAGAELSILKEALSQVQKAKIPIVVGAGDSMDVYGVAAVDKLFKSFDNIFVITSVNKESELSLMANIDSQDVLTAAPGEEVLTTKPGNKYETVNGTAFAAAHVAGALGLAKAELGDRMDYRKLQLTLISAKGSEPAQNLSRFTRGGNRLQIAKFLNEVKSL